MNCPLATLAAAALLLGACTYDFSNPAERLDAGEIAGRVVADAGGGIAGLAGVRVRLRNASESVAVEQLTRDNGRFILLGLMPGHHTVLFDKVNPVGATTWAITRDVDVAWGSDGQPEGVILGDVQIRYPVTITGSFTVPTAGSFYPTSVFAWDDDTGRAATFPPTLDLSGTVQTSAFTYTFDGLSVGPHRLRFAVVGQECTPYPFCTPATYLLGPVVKDVVAGQEGQTIPMSPLSIPSLATGTGKLRFRVVAPPSLAGSYSYAASVSNATFASAEVCSTYSDGTRECDVAAGAYLVTVLTTPADATFYDPPVATGIVSAGQTTDLGALYITDYGVATKASNACVTDADCTSGLTCKSGSCVYSGPALSACMTGGIIASECSTPYNGCLGIPPSAPATCMGGSGLCGRAPDASYVCVPVGSMECLWDGPPQVPVIPVNCAIN